MIFQLVGSIELHAALVALEKLKIQMSPLVVLHVAVGDELLAAEGAGEILLPRVGPHMLQQTAVVLVLLGAAPYRALLHFLFVLSYHVLKSLPGTLAHAGRIFVVQFVQVDLLLHLNFFHEVHGQLGLLNGLSGNGELAHVQVLQHLVRHSLHPLLVNFLNHGGSAITFLGNPCS